MIIKSCFTFLLFCFFLMGYSQSLYNSDKIKELYEILPENCKQEFIKHADYIECTADRNNINLKCKKENGKITHIGFSTFKQHEITLFPEEVYFFIERFFLEYFLTSDFSTFKTINEDNRISFSYNGYSIEKNDLSKTENISMMLSDDHSTKTLNHDSLIYIFTVTDNKNSIELTFPANNVLIKGMDKYDLDSYLESQLNEYESHNYNYTISQDRKYHKSGNIYIFEGEEYYKNINSKTYYYKVDDEYLLVYDKDYYMETLANIFLTGHKNPDKKIAIQHRKYGGVNSFYSVNINDFVEYFKNNHFDIFFGSENTSKESIKATVVFRNSYLNFINLIYIQTSVEDLFNENPINIKFYSNIPIDNIKDIYGIYFDEKLD